MVRPVLNTSDIDTINQGPWQFEVFIELPKTARDFGYVPDVRALLPGDAVLQAPVRPTAVATWIRRWQTDSGLSADNACWTHVAIHVGGGVLVENMPGAGVRMASIYDRIPSHAMLIRRDPELVPDIRFLLVIKALIRLGRAYSTWELPAMAARAVAGFWKPNGKARQSKALVCSTLYSDAYVEATARPVLAEGRIEDVWPGHIAATSRLTDVTVPWVGVA